MDSLPPISSGRGGAVRTTQTGLRQGSLRSEQQSAGGSSPRASGQRHDASAAQPSTSLQTDSGLSPSVISRDEATADRRVEWVVQQLYGCLVSSQSASVSDALCVLVAVRLGTACSSLRDVEHLASYRKYNMSNHQYFLCAGICAGAL